MRHLRLGIFSVFCLVHYIDQVCRSTSNRMQCAMCSGRANKDSDAFTKREAAQENFYIHEKEMEKYVITVSRVFCSLS